MRKFIIIDNGKTFCFDFILMGKRENLFCIKKRFVFLIQANRTTKKNEYQENCVIINRVVRGDRKRKIYQKNERLNAFK